MIKYFFMVLITAIPSNKLRLVCLRFFFKYNISYNSYIGLFNIIDCNSCSIKKSKIGSFNYINSNELIMEEQSEIKRFNRFNNLNKILIKSDSVIVNRNTFSGTSKGVTPYKNLENFIMGRKSIITKGHSFDLSDSITIGENVTFAGSNSQVWTHGFDINHIKIQAPINIGNNIYIGSSCIISLGVNITDYVSIGAGTVVARPINESGFYVSSHLIKKSEIHNFLDYTDIEEHNKAKFIKRTTI